MNKAFVKIDWISSTSGGRQKPPEGTSYIAVVRFPGMEDDEWMNNAWSIRLEFLGGKSNGGVTQNYALASFLSPDAPMDQMIPDAEFDLYEGPRPVAHVRVLLSERLVEQLIAFAA